MAVSVGPNLQLNMINHDSDHPKDANAFVVQPMSDLSCTAPFFGQQVNEVISLIISVMSAAGSRCQNQAG
jgi:hypothetical protein